MHIAKHYAPAYECDDDTLGDSMDIRSKLRDKLHTTIVLAIIAVILIGVIIVTDKLNQAYVKIDATEAENTVKEYAVQCYALEGSYPDSLDYLTENYTLTLDKDKFVYHYNYIGANMIPEITVFPKN